MRGVKYGLLVAALVGCGAVLAACGGDERPSRPGTRIGEAGPEPGVPAVGVPDMETGPASVWAASVVGGADALFATSVHEESGFGARQVHDTECSGLRCSGSGSGTIGIGNAGGLASGGVVGQTGDIDLVSASDVDAGSWGGWMRHSGFGVLLERDGMGSQLGEARYGLAVGALSDVGPGRDVEATWQGRMVGVMEAGGFSAGRLTGVATLSYQSVEAAGADSEAGDVVGRIDAAFTDIENVLTGAPAPAAYFVDVPVSLLDVTTAEVEVPDPEGAAGETLVEVVLESVTMAFDAGSSGNRIRGAFFGPDRDEVSGIFEQNGILGAFGATRE